MKKLILTALLLTASAFASAADTAPDYKLCEYDNLLPMKVKGDRVLVVDHHDYQFEAYYVIGSSVMVQEPLTSSMNKTGNDSYATPNDDLHFAVASVSNGFYGYKNKRNGDAVITISCEQAPDDLIMQLPGFDEEAYNASIDAAGHGSEFEERGDIARPEYKGANTFIGEAFGPDDKSMGKVKLVRAENGDITVTFPGYETETYKLNPDMAAGVGEYDEPRLTTEFGVAQGPGFIYTITVYNTKIVK